MLAYKKCQFFLIILVSFPKKVLQMEAYSNYGPFRLNYQKIETCKGPKSQDCGKTVFQLYNPGDNSTRLKMFIDLHKDCPMIHAKVAANSLQDAGPKNLFNYVVENPCQHFYFGPTLKVLLNMTEKCILKKGSYRLDIDTIRYVQDFFGDKFFYGSFAFKTIIYNQHDNLVCTKTQINFDKI